MKWLWTVILLLLAACSVGTPPLIDPHGKDWQLRPGREAQVWRFRFGNPRTSAVESTVLASQAQVTAAGLTVLLDEWGGNKSATWMGLTGAPDRSRVWIDVQDATAPGGYRAIFSGTLVRRPSLASGQREAVGDKYLRLKDLPLSREKSGFPDGVDVGQLIRELAAEATVATRLPHLTAPLESVPNANVNGKRRHNGESVAAALDGLVSLKGGWGWTTLPDDRLYFGPPPAVEAVIPSNMRGNRVTFRDVSSEGLRNAIQWVLTTPAGQVIRTETQHASVATLGYAGGTLYVDQRSLPALGATAAATYDTVADAGEANPTPVSPPATWRDEDAVLPAGALAVFRYRVQLTEAADWVEISAQAANSQGFFVTYSGPGVPETRVDRFAGGMQRVVLPALPAGSMIRITAWNVPGDNTVQIAELHPRKLSLPLLAAAAEEYYRVPPESAGTASLPGIHPAAGTARVTRPGQPDVTGRVVATKYLLVEPARTEYVFGEPDVPLDTQVLKVLIDRKDEAAAQQAITTRSTP